MTVLPSLQHDLESAVDEIAEAGAASVPALDEAKREALLQECAALPFAAASGSVGSYGVRQSMEVCREVPANSALWECTSELDHTLSRVFGTAGSGCCDDPEFSMNELVLQRYPAGSGGISPHRDGKRFRCVIGILVLGGDGNFALCADREGNEARPLDGRPGRLILLRAPGFRGIEARPFHFVSEVRSERTVLTLRYDTRS